MFKPRVSIIMPTYNRLHLIGNAIRSILNQTYKDFELIVVDDCPEKRAEEVVKKFKDKRIIYVKHEQQKGGAAARNTGIRIARGDFIGFIDDDDEWLPKKLEIQMKKFKNTSNDVGFCFSAVRNILEDREKNSKVPEGIADYYELALRRFKGFLTITLIIKKFVFDKVGLFDETLPSHQEPDLIIRIARRYKGLGINKPLARLNLTAHDQIGRNLKKRIKGREIILKKYYNEFRKRPVILAKHYFQLGLWYRDGGQYKQARKILKKAWKTKFKLRYFLHYLSMFFDGGFIK